ncbi:MAG: ferritin-like domain-containing protein [Desulfomonilaceae bacterium]
MFVFGTADDAFAMAVRIEENGNAFYAGAAEMTKNPEVKKLFEDLALMEASHIKIFRTLRSQLPDSASEAVWDPEGLAESYLEASADSHVFTVEAATDRLKTVKTAVEALDMALLFEKDSLAFFLGIKEILPDLNGRDEIDKLIKSEMLHIRMLSGVKRRLVETGTGGIF